MSDIICNCPKCNKVLDDCTGLNTYDKPEENSLSVCWYCATMLRFDKECKLVVLTDEQFKALDKESQVVLNSAVKFIVNKHK